MLRTGQLLAPSQGRRCSASTAGSRPPPGAALPGTLASPRTGLTPAGCHELLARLRRPPPFSLTPELLVASPLVVYEPVEVVFRGCRGARAVGERGATAAGP